MKPSTIALQLVLLMGLTLSGFGQQNANNRVGGLELGIGLNTFGPAAGMGELMEEFGFDERVMDWVAFDRIDYPDYAPASFSIQANYAKYLDYKRRVGVTLQYSRLREVSGYSDISGQLDILFSSIFVSPTYMMSIGQYLEIKGGPAVMMNRGRTTNLYEENVSIEAQKRMKIAPGILAGLNVWLWYGTNTYGKVGGQYLLALPQKMGPFSAIYGFGEEETIPESKLGFSHLNVLFVFGVHLWEMGD